MAQRHTDSRAASTGLLGHRVLPIVLAGPAHNHQVPVTKAELMGSLPPWSEQEPPPTAERNRSHQRVLVGVRCVAVPGHAVAAVAVQVDPDPVERDAIVRQ